MCNQCTLISVLHFSFVSDFYWALFRKTKHKSMFSQMIFVFLMHVGFFNGVGHYDCLWVLFKLKSVWGISYIRLMMEASFGSNKDLMVRAYKITDLDTWRWECLPLVVKWSSCTFYTLGPQSLDMLHHAIIHFKHILNVTARSDPSARAAHDTHSKHASTLKL